MNHLEAAFRGRNHIWRYVIMLAAVLIVSNTLGAIPLIVAAFIKSGSNPELFANLAANPNDYSVLGMNSNMLLAVMLFPFIAGLVTFILLVKPLNERSIMDTINGSKKLRWDRFFMAGFVWMALAAIYFFVYMGVDPANFRLNNATSSLAVLIIVSVLLVPFQAAFEEIIFRGYLMQGFAKLFAHRWFPLLMTSVLFGLMHAFNPEVKEFGFFTMMPQYILFGLIFGLITVLDDGIEAAMGAHTANNIFLCIMVTNRASALQTDALYEQIGIYPWTEFAALLATGVVFVFILSRLFGWKSFSVLTGKIEKPPVQS
ncbi:MAG: CPBP family intramembrane metalloprotease [Bacteroidales bacterium]|nr:CPBP family intramembrane metalloprotease [Bacteroidales bacterium]